ncbi:hypothetical protein KCP71_19180 [Salmonella enterica subsp. enterica]|nr:hypothetical protein KCP71_19180 [Salmonella enterica subsp. enterica]
MILHPPPYPAVDVLFLIWRCKEQERLGGWAISGRPTTAIPFQHLLRAAICPMAAS